MINTEHSAVSNNSLDNFCYPCSPPEYAWTYMLQWLIGKFYFKCWVSAELLKWHKLSHYAILMKELVSCRNHVCVPRKSNGPSPHGPSSSQFLQRHRMNKNLLGITKQTEKTRKNERSFELNLQNTGVTKKILKKPHPFRNLYFSFCLLAFCTWPAVNPGESPDPKQTLLY